jgi:hypothetical protein
MGVAANSVDMTVVKIQVALVDVRASFIVVERRGGGGVRLQSSIA